MLSIPQIQAYIDTNPRIFRQGVAISETQLCAMFNITPPTITTDFNQTSKAFNRYHLSKLSAYTKLNKVLRRCGLVIRQEEDGRTYRIQNGEGTVKRIVGLASEAASKRLTQHTLTDGYSTYGGRWQPQMPQRT